MTNSTNFERRTIQYSTSSEKLQALKAKSLIEDIGDGFNGVIVHDLYLDFVKFEVKKGALDTRRWIWYDKEAVYPVDLVRTPSGNCWSNVERISVNYIDDEYYMLFRYTTPKEGSKKSIHWKATIEGMKWQKFCNVVVLQLFIGRNDVLDLQGLRCLKSMELRWNYESYEGCKSGGQVIGLGSLKNLAWLDMHNIHYALCIQEIGQLSSLEVLRLDTNCYYGSPCSKPLEPPNLDNCIFLQELLLECACLESFPNLSKLTSLRKILFKGFQNAKEVVGLGSHMTSLQELLLLDCYCLRQCLGLGDVLSLQRFDVTGCSQLSQIPNLHKLTKLRRLNLTSCKFTKVLGLNNSMSLHELLVPGSEIEELPNLHLVRHLHRLYMSGIRPMAMPRFDSFVDLEELILDDLQEIRDIHGMHSLTRLKKMTIRDAPNLLQLPELGDLMALQFLSLHNCCTLVENLNLLDLHNLVNLEILGITLTPIRRLLSLERLRQLRDLCCSGTLLFELSIPNGLKKLESIDLSGCRELTSLENVGTLPALGTLNVVGCSSLTRLPNLRGCKNLEYLSISNSGVNVSPEDIMTLATLPVLKMQDWDYAEVFFSKLLEEMSLEAVVLHLEAKKLHLEAKKRERSM